jgi:hypothetical protein
MILLRSSILPVLLVVSTNISGQNLIGYKVNEIKKYMRDKEKDFNFQNSVYNSTFKYLKYQDNNETQTLLFFLTADSVCKGVRLISDKSLETEKIKELNSAYTPAGNNTWRETRNGKNYIIELKEDEWSFNVNYIIND